MKVFITNPIPELGTHLLHNTELEILQGFNDTSEKDWDDMCSQADIILNVGNSQFNQDFFNRYPNIKAISLFSVGYDSVDISLATKLKIPVGNTPDVLSRATSDVSFLLMQAVARKMNYNTDLIKSGNWTTFDAIDALGLELYDKTLGIFGLGRIGFEMARKCKAAFNMNIIYHNRTRNEKAEAELGANYVSFDDLVCKSDVLSVHAYYSADQFKIFNKDVFSKMKPDALFINTARGGFHDEDDLYEALVNKTIWGAGLDVTNPEPMSKDNPLLKLENVCVLPHIGSATVVARNGMAKIAAENVISFSQNKKMKYCVNPEVY